MEVQKNQVGQLSAVNMQLSKYLFKDPDTGQGKCRICKAVVKNSGFLRLHLQKMHRVQFNPPQNSGPPIIQNSNKPNPNLSKSQQKPHPTHNIFPKKDWLSPFQQQISDPSSDEVDQNKDQNKYLINATQFTQPLKYFQYNRYLDEQITQVKEQMSQLTCLRKIPPMVTMEENQENFCGQGKSDKYGIQRFRNWLKVRVQEIGLAYQLVQSKNQLNQMKQTESKLIDVQNSQNICNQIPQTQQKSTETQKEKQKPILNKYLHLLTQFKISQQTPQCQIIKQLSYQNFMITHIQKHKKQNMPCSTQSKPPTNSPINQPQMSQQQLAQPQPQVQPQPSNPQLETILHHHHDPQQEYQQQQCQVYTITHPDLVQIYQKYGDALCMMELGVHGAGVLVIGVENWRLQFLVVGVIVVTNKGQASLTTLQNSLTVFFNTLNTALPKSITFLHNNKQPSFKQPLHNFINSLPGTLKKPHIISPKPNNQPITCNPIQQKITNLYTNFITRVSGIVAKYKSASTTVDIQLINSDSGNCQRDKQIQKLVESFRGKQCLDPRTCGLQCYHRSRCYRGLYLFEGNLQKYATIMDSIMQNISAGNNPINIGTLLSNILQKFTQIYHNNNPQPQNPTHPSTLISPTISSIVQKIQTKTQYITHLKHLTPNIIQVYSAIPITQLQSSTQSGRCLLYKNVVVYSQFGNCWYCNCDLLVQIGLPCYHLIMIVNKMGGSIQYYIHPRWTPSTEELQILELETKRTTQSKIVSNNGANMEVINLQEIKP